MMGKRKPPPFDVCSSETIADGAVEILEYALKRAKAGELSSVSIAWTTREGNFGNDWTGGPHFAAQLGSVARLFFELNQHRELET